MDPEAVMARGFMPSAISPGRAPRLTGPAIGPRLRSAEADAARRCQKLVILGAFIVVGVSFGFLTLNLWLASRWIEEDVRAGVVAFARVMAATISSRQEFESGAVLQAQAGDILTAREDLLQLDVLAFRPQEVTWSHDEPGALTSIHP
jgi:hypothetical protein